MAIGHRRRTRVKRSPGDPRAEPNRIPGQQIGDKLPPPLNIIRAKTISPEKYHIWATGTRISKKKRARLFCVLGLLVVARALVRQKMREEGEVHSRPAVVGG